MNVREYLESKNWKFKPIDSPRGKQFQLLHCPYCGKRDHFYIHAETGQYICHAGQCGEQGSIYTLKKAMGDIMPIQGFQDLEPSKTANVPQEQLWADVNAANQRLLQDKEALRWCSKRRWTLQAIQDLHLGLSEEDGRRWLWYPFISSGKISNVKKRSISGERGFIRLLGGKSDLFNSDALLSGAATIVIAEGESDLVTLYSMGFRNAIGVSVGAKGFNPEWIDLLDKMEKIYIVYDTDIVGQEGALSLAKRLGLERCFNVKLPSSAKDVNEYFVKGGDSTKFLDILNGSKPFDVEGVRHALTVVEDMILREIGGLKERDGFGYPWPMIDRVAGRMGPGDLITVAGNPGSGKTNLVLDIIYHWARQEVPVMLFELEFPPEKLIGRLIGMHFERDMDPLKGPSLVELQEFHESFKEVPFYFAYRHRPPDWGTVEATIKECVRRYGIKILAFDNIHYLVRSVNDQTREVSFISQQFKNLAKELEIPILLVARPRKTRGPIDSQDIKDSSDIHGDSDTIILINRRKNNTGDTGIGFGTYAAETAINVDKARWGPGGGILLTAVDAQARFTDGTVAHKEEKTSPPQDNSPTPFDEAIAKLPETKVDMEQIGGLKDRKKRY